jgi:hypothetical protein
VFPLLPIFAPGAVDIIGAVDLGGAVDIIDAVDLGGAVDIIDAVDLGGAVDIILDFILLCISFP